MVDVAKLIKYGVFLAKSIEAGKSTLTQIREAIKQDHPESLEAFDRDVAEARAPWNSGAEAGARENAAAKEA